MSGTKEDPIVISDSPKLTMPKLLPTTPCPIKLKHHDWKVENPRKRMKTGKHIFIQKRQSARLDLTPIFELIKYQS